MEHGQSIEVLEKVNKEYINNINCGKRKRKQTIHNETFLNLP